MKRIIPWASAAGLGFALFALVLGGTAYAQSETAANAADLGQTFIERLAGKLGVSTDTLEEAIDESRDEALDEAVTAGLLSQEQADRMRERWTTGSFFPEEKHGSRPGNGLFGPSLDSLAAILGIDESELREELQSGETLVDLIAGAGLTLDEVVEGLVEDASARLDEEVDAGRITRDEADEKLADLPEHYTRMIEMGGLGHGPGWKTGRQ